MGMTANFTSPGGKILISFGLVASALCGCEAAPYMAPDAAVEVADAADVTDAAMPGADGGDDTLGISDTTVNEGGSAADAVPSVAVAAVAATRVAMPVRATVTIVPSERATAAARADRAPWRSLAPPGTATMGRTRRAGTVRRPWPSRQGATPAG